MTSDTIVSSALLDIVRAAEQVDVMIALIGGEALIAYGVQRITLDADLLLAPEDLEALANELITVFSWTPLEWSDRANKFVEARSAVVHYMDDKVLFDIGQERRMIPLRSPFGLPLDMLAAQHPIEQEMVDLAMPRTHHQVRIRIAPLGGILLVKTKADRPKDQIAIQQTTEFLSGDMLNKAVAWARRRDPASAEDLQSLIEEVQILLRPKHTEAVKPSKKTAKRAVKRRR